MYYKNLVTTETNLKCFEGNFAKIITAARVLDCKNKKKDFLD